MRFVPAILITLLVLTGAAGTAQVNRYLVWFSTKIGTPYSIAEPKNFLSDRSIARRTRQQILLTEADLPVVPSYKTAVQETGARVLYASRWMNAALVEATDAQLLSIAALSFVTKTELAAPGAVPVAPASPELPTRTSGRTTAENQTQLVQLGIDQLHADGWNGSGIRIAVMDSGFPEVLQATGFSNIRPRILDTYNFPWKRSDVYGYDEHGADVLSIIGGQLPEGYSGSAPGAEFLLYITEYVPSEYRVEEFNWLLAAERADSAGADVINTSLGYSTFDDAAMNYTYADMNGTVTLISRAASMAADRGIVVVVSAGNEGSGSWRYITAPADARGILAVGSVNDTGLVSAFSSRGPSSDGRIKPDVAALGFNTTLLAGGTVLAGGSGTSFAAPLITGLTAGILQSRQDLSAAEVISLIRSAGSQADLPDNDVGYGVPNYNSIRLVVGLSEDNGFQLSPNPAEGNEVCIQFPDTGYEAQDVVLVSSTGQIRRPAYENDSSTGRAVIRLDDTAPGLYLLRAQLINQDESRQAFWKILRLVRR